MVNAGLSRIARGLLRRAHYILVDKAFDRIAAVDTFDTESKPPADGVWSAGNYDHASSPAIALWHAVTSLGIDIRKFVFVDLGSGKGRALLVASALPFLRVEGVEFSPELHQIALANVRNYSRAKAPIITYQLDAREYRIPKEPCLFYLFNPFGEAVLCPVLRNILASWHETPRPIYVVYMNPMKKHLFEQSSFMQNIPRSRWQRALDALLLPHAVEFYCLSPEGAEQRSECALPAASVSGRLALSKIS